MFYVRYYQSQATGVVRIQTHKADSLVEAWNDAVCAETEYLTFLAVESEFDFCNVGGLSKMSQEQLKERALQLFNAYAEQHAPAPGSKVKKPAVQFEVWREPATEDNPDKTDYMDAVRAMCGKS